MRALSCFCDVTSKPSGRDPTPDPTPRNVARPCSRYAHRLAVLEAREVPFAPASPSRVETRSGSSASDPPYPQTSGPGRDQTEVEAGTGAGKRSVSHFCQTAVEASVSTGSPRSSGRPRSGAAGGRAHPEELVAGYVDHPGDRLRSVRIRVAVSPTAGRPDKVQFSKHERTSSLYGTLNPPTSSVDPGLAFSHCAAASSCSRRSGLPVIVLASPRCRQTTGAGLRAALDRRQK